MRMRLVALSAILLAITACSHTRDNPCDPLGNVFDTSLFGEDARQDYYEMGWVKNISGNVCGFLMDKYEASRRDATPDYAGKDNEYDPRSLKGYVPWANVTYADAVKACAGKQGSEYKRICRKSELILACNGGYHKEPDPLIGQNLSTIYPYGDSYMPTFCNGKDFCEGKTGCTSGLVVTGEATDCGAVAGVIFSSAKYPKLYDLTGNLGEWAEDDDNPGHGVVVGGSWNSDSEGLKCASVDASKTETAAYDDVGFRCCK